MRTVASRFLGGAGSGAKALGFSSGNGASKGSFSGSKIAGSVPSSMGWSSYSSNSNYDGRGTYLIFNAGDTLYISDLNSSDKDPVKTIQFGNSNPVCHAFGPEIKDGHDLLIGMQSGEIYSVSLRQQLHDVGKRLAGGQHYNKDGVITSRGSHTILTGDVFLGNKSDDPSGHLQLEARMYGASKSPKGLFEVGPSPVTSSFVGDLLTLFSLLARGISRAHVLIILSTVSALASAGFLKGKDAAADCSFPYIKDQTHFSVAHSRSNKQVEEIPTEDKDQWTKVDYQPSLRSTKVTRVDSHSDCRIIKSPLHPQATTMLIRGVMDAKDGSLDREPSHPSEVRCLMSDIPLNDGIEFYPDSMELTESDHERPSTPEAIIMPTLVLSDTINEILDTDFCYPDETHCPRSCLPLELESDPMASKERVRTTR
ncbi:hypothetical protein KSP39_PZI006329 [Platanthera zijinensis]|uniref:Uncharacterized protein n=1 Tax=Platanthera zijinensis TaxID=2320716 RepID=A0AAP0GB77_9ASPA